MIGAIGMGLTGFGGTSSAIGGAISGNKAKKAKKKQLQQGMNDFQLGSTDASGNRYNFNQQRGWGYDLSNAGKAARTAANRGIYQMNTLGNISPSQAANNMIAADYNAARTQALANQSAATRNALRTGSNVGDIIQTYGGLGSATLRNIMQQHNRNALNLQAQNAQNYANVAQSLAKPYNDIMTNLQNQQNGAATQQMQLRQAMADAAGTPTTNALQVLGSIGQGVGGAMSKYDMGNKLMRIEAMKALLGNDPNTFKYITPENIKAILAMIGE